ncbi:hypothetical protein GCM10010492_29030 [Saccharothrix mutabilis subsp. mutabilis]|uniref:Uncharacterized protein n=1 Tax=Saccharothrix mutabilis subsp. mutabilis TaxID=66855 RepID=A0ABN0TS82_9PSEU
MSFTFIARNGIRPGRGIGENGSKGVAQRAKAHHTRRTRAVHKAVRRVVDRAACPDPAAG